MAVSELLGSQCPHCLAIWRTCKDFSRANIREGIARLNSPDGPTITTATYWEVRCNACRDVTSIMWEADA